MSLPSTFNLPKYTTSWQVEYRLAGVRARVWHKDHDHTKLGVQLYDDDELSNPKFWSCASELGPRVPEFGSRDSASRSDLRWQNEKERSPVTHESEIPANPYSLLFSGIRVSNPCPGPWIIPPRWCCSCTGKVCKRRKPAPPSRDLLDFATYGDRRRPKVFSVPATAFRQYSSVR
jgi:hypothetical protein